MEPLIYYPTFEPPSDIWLKFSLLYFENFRPIIPNNRRHLISNNFSKVHQETDLVEMYSPDYKIGGRASLSAIEEVEKIRNNVYGRSGLFNEVNVLRKWTNSENWNFLVFREKFSDDWVQYCQGKKLGRQVQDGILLSDELAFLFMAHLAKEIAFTESASIITDNNRFDNFTNYSRVTTPSVDARSRFAKGLINFLVPKDLAKISFEKLIKFRNKNRKLIRAFNEELYNIQERIGDGYSNSDFIDNYNNIYSEISKEVVILGTGIAAIPFAAYMLLTNPKALTPEYIKEILSGLGMILGGGYALNKALKDNQSKRYCKKYLLNLERIK